MARGQQFFPMRGGLDQETPAIAIPPGRAIACLNHEAEPLGYRRTEGYERFDGRPSPSDTRAYLLEFTNGWSEPFIGMYLRGAISGATCIALSDSTASTDSWNKHRAEGTIYVRSVTGAFVAGEAIQSLFGGFVMILVSAPTEVDWREGDTERTQYLAAIEDVRADITAVPGSGPVRGVLWFDGKLTAWRDDAGATKCVPWDSSTAGWVAKDLGQKVNFTSGGPYEIKVGDTIVGSGSGATAVVRAVALDNGDWADGDAEGIFILDSVTGAFFAENLNVGININAATTAAAPAAMTFPPGGRYEFDIYNFYATEGLTRAYGVNGVGPGFEYDGTSAIPFSTGMADDTPFLIREHKDHLFMAFRHGSLQHSELGAPRQWSGTFGAAELGLGHEITNLLTTETMLLATTTDTVQMLTGNDSSDWLLQPVSKDAGAIAWTAARVGEAIYLDYRGVRSVASAQAYGNFKLGVFTSLINKLLENKRKAGVAPVASCVVKTKSQYLLFFGDGSGVSIFFGVKQPEAMPFLYPFVASCIHVAEVDGVERIFVGAQDGFVYELNKGTSFDGAEIEAFIQLPFNHHGDPRLNKRWHKLELELHGDAGTELGIIPQYNGGDGEQPFVVEDSLTVAGGGGLWGLATWGDFFWSAPQVAQADMYIDGCGTSMSAIIVSRSALFSSYTIAGTTVVFSGRGRKR